MAGISHLIPLFVLFAFVGVLAYVGYHIFIWSGELADRGKKKLEKKNMSFTSDGGLRVNVKEMSSESYADKTQNVLVNTWNHASFPNYKSKLGWNSAQPEKSKSSPTTSPRPGASRENSGTTRPTTSYTTSTTLKPPEQRSSAKRSTSPVPGGWE